jgi:peptidoglycan hydrolase-like protein with peptidoglycan-binding domain
VRVHSDNRAADAAVEINASAFTTGADIHFAAGRYQPGTAHGNQLLAHELTHVAQQSAGPAGISASPDDIQRRMGDGHDLSSPWLAGDLRLEDIFDDVESRFLRRGSRGTSVKRVQQLLFFLGFDIGSEGADGIFGEKTDAAVRAFQQQFAPPRDGIVGPITIGALDVRANQPPPNRTTPGAPPGRPPAGTPPSLSVDRIDVVNSAAGAIGGFPAIVGGASLNTPGPFNAPDEVKNSHQLHFHLDHGSSADLTPLREIQRTATMAGGVVLDNPPDQVLPPGVAGPPAPGGFRGVLIGPDGPAAHEIQRPTADTIVVADAPGLQGLTAGNFPITYRSHFHLTVSDAANAPIARVNYDVLIDRRSVADVPNTENRIVATARKDFVRGQDL